MGWLNEMNVTVMATGVCAFALTVGLGAALLPLLRYLKVGQSIREEGPSWHKSKAGTPTMGGICFILAFLLCVGGYAIFRGVRGEGRDLIPLALSVLFAFGNAAIGFVDDYCKLVKKQNEGLTEKQKLVLQAVLCAAYLCMMRLTGHLPTSFRIPFTETRWELSCLAYPIYLLVLAGFVNATNLTDGLDGLASSVCAVVSGFMILFSAMKSDTDIGVLACALLGGMLGFLVFNHHPAKMFMGDTGSLFLGGVIMGCALMADELLLFVMAGFVFVIDMLTSLIQRFYFKLTHGKRLFKMAPVHHHFEKCGWSEGQIVALFVGVSVLFCLAAWLGI